MKKLLFHDYKTTVSNACLISSFSNLFFNCGTSITESDIFFLGKGLKLTINWQQDKALSEISLFHDANIMITNFFHEIDMDIKIIQIPGWECEESYRQFIKSQIDQSIPVIVAVHTKHIPYYIVPPKTYRPHFLTIIGYEKQLAYVSDCLVPGVVKYETYCGAIPFSILYKAAVERDFIYYEYDYKKTVKRLKTNISEEIHWKYKSSISEFIVSEVPKYLQMSDMIEQMPDNHSINEIHDAAEDIFFHIKYNGILYGRVLVRDHFMDNYNQNNNLEGWVKEHLDKNISLWEGLNYSLLKNNMTSCNKQKYIDIKNRIIDIIDSETRAYKEMITILDQEDSVKESRLNQKQRLK